MNLNLVSQLVGGRSREDVNKDLDAFFLLRSNDQEKVKSTIEAIFKASTKHEHVRKPDLIGIVVGKLTQDSLDGDLRDRLAERAAEVIEACYKVNPRKGVINPYHVEAPPTSQQLAQAGNVR